MTPADLDAIERDLREVYLAQGMADAFAKLRKDAERYRLLRDNAPDQMCVRIWQQITRYGIAQPDSRLSGNALDAAIDAALKEPK